MKGNCGQIAARPIAPNALTEWLEGSDFFANPALLVRIYNPVRMVWLADTIAPFSEILLALHTLRDQLAEQLFPGDGRLLNGPLLLFDVAGHVDALLVGDNGMLNGLLSLADLRLNPKRLAQIQLTAAEAHGAHFYRRNHLGFVTKLRHAYFAGCVHGALRNRLSDQLDRETMHPLYQLCKVLAEFGYPNDLSSPQR
ncbi:MAG: hypothetical protein KDE19_00615 [Caldilineaceae bacterium]|nr:hypothetical protein [Caldilineaceae bacterium]